MQPPEGTRGGSALLLVHTLAMLPRASVTSQLIISWTGHHLNVSVYIKIYANYFFCIHLPVSYLFYTSSVSGLLPPSQFILPPQFPFGNPKFLFFSLIF